MQFSIFISGLRLSLCLSSCCLWRESIICLQYQNDCQINKYQGSFLTQGLNLSPFWFQRPCFLQSTVWLTSGHESLKSPLESLSTPILIETQVSSSISPSSSYPHLFNKEAIPVQIQLQFLDPFPPPIPLPLHQFMPFISFPPDHGNSLPTLSTYFQCFPVV